MKEKISDYLDGRVDKEEMEKSFEEHPEERDYYNQLLAMKAVLSEMKVNAPDIASAVLAKTKRRSLLRKLSMVVSVAAIILVSGFLVKMYVFKPKANVETAYNPNQGLKSFSPMVQKPSIDITINKSREGDLLKILRTDGTIVSVEDRQQAEGTGSQTKIIKYKFDVNKLTDIDKAVKAINGAGINKSSAAYWDTATGEVEVDINLTEN
jgi:hypothetical protein